MSIEEIKYFAVTKDGAIMKCDSKNCDMCKFNDFLYCNAPIIKWLLEEYKEPETDWTKVAVDTLVIIKFDDKSRVEILRYFAGVNANGKPTVFRGGATSKTNGTEPPYVPYEVKLYKEGDE